MNRPELLEYWSTGLYDHKEDYIDYINDMEEYCDELEKALEHLLDMYVLERCELSRRCVSCKFYDLCTLTGHKKTPKEIFREMVMKDE